MPTSSFKKGKSKEEKGSKGEKLGRAKMDRGVVRGGGKRV
jgi:hypothetical protein